MGEGHYGPPEIRERSAGARGISGSSEGKNHPVPNPNERTDGPFPNGGSFHSHPESDASFPHPPQLFFANIPQSKLKEELRAKQLAADHVQGTNGRSLVKPGGKKVLLDIGAGSMVPNAELGG